jgi:hypothetical protein
LADLGRKNHNPRDLGGLEDGEVGYSITRSLSGKIMRGRL